MQEQKLVVKRIRDSVIKRLGSVGFLLNTTVRIGDKQVIFSTPFRQKKNLRAVRKKVRQFLLNYGNQQKSA